MRCIALQGPSAEKFISSIKFQVRYYVFDIGDKGEATSVASAGKPVGRRSVGAGLCAECRDLPRGGLALGGLHVLRI